MRARTHICLWLLLMIMPTTALAADDVAEVIARARLAVVTIFSVDSKGKEISQGSGFVVRENGLILTAAHVVSRASSLRIKFVSSFTRECTTCFRPECTRFMF